MKLLRAPATAFANQIDAISITLKFTAALPAGY